MTEGSVEGPDFPPDVCPVDEHFYSQSRETYWLDHDNGMRIFMPKATYNAMVFNDKKIAAAKLAEAKEACLIKKVTTRKKRWRKPKMRASRVAVDNTSLFMPQSQEIVTFVNAADRKSVV